MQPVSMSGADAGSFTYDGNYKRVKQVINGETVYSVYGLSGELLYRDNATTGETTDYVNYAGGVTFRFLGNGQVHTVASDHLGSPIVANRGIHRQIWREEYTPHGEPRLSPAANDNDQGFTGHIADTDTGLAYMQARYYDPVIGRFLSPDPVGFASGGPAYFNRYAYVANDPVNNIDPDGRQIIEDGKFIFTVSGGVSGTGALGTNSVSGGAEVLIENSFDPMAFIASGGPLNPAQGLSAAITVRDVAVVGSGGLSGDVTVNGESMDMVGFGVSADFDIGEVGASLGGISDRLGNSFSIEADVGHVGGEVFSNFNTLEGTGFRLSLFGPGIGIAATENNTALLVETDKQIE